MTIMLVAGVQTASAQGQAAFCRSSLASMMSDDDEAQIAEVARICKPGDIIGIPPGGRGGSRAVPRLCDFTKSMPVVSGMLYCVMAAPRPFR
ncbi:hypothetical protein [Dankookia sp. GCM10030260]|uniref:hypothetical protein n=1 Tax=Dankookia sp. GCM10030260 TaxID=3273390 RepID=UPI0036D34CFF